MAYTLPELEYPYDALEVAIDATTMEIHHQKHHATYLKNLNHTLENSEDLMEMPIEALLSDLELVPKEIRPQVINNGGGHYHHSIFWRMMAPGKVPMSDTVKSVIDKSFGSVDKFKESFKTTALSQFGSGWAWLIDNGGGKLEIIKTSNQDSPITQGKIPLLGIDVWEHAYYLRYQNRRADYIDAWWSVVNWQYVEEQYFNQEV